MDNSLGIFGAIAGFCSLLVNMGLFYAFFREKARTFAETSAAKASAEAAATQTEAHKARVEGCYADSQAFPTAATTKAGIAEAKATGAEAKADAVAESLAALNSKITQRWRDEEKRTRKKARAEAEGEDDEPAEPAPKASVGFSQEDLFAALQAQAAITGGQAQAEAGPVEAVNGKKRLTPRRVR